MNLNLHMYWFAYVFLGISVRVKNKSENAVLSIHFHSISFKNLLYSCFKTNLYEISEEAPIIDLEIFECWLKFFNRFFP